MQIPPRPRTAVLFDSSLEEGVGPVLALATLLAADARREVRIGSLSVSRNSLEIAAFCDLMVRFYRGEQPGTSPEGNSIPIGMFDEGAAVRVVSAMITRVVHRTGPDGLPLYPTAIAEHNDTADPVATIRNALSAQEDQSAVIVLAGPPVNLLGLLNLPGGSELAEAKVRELVLTEESLTDLIERWPSRVVVAGEDLSLRYPATSIEEDLAWATDHPVIDAYRAAGITNDPSVHAAAAVLCALHPDGDYFGSSETAPGLGPYRKLTADAGQRERALGEIRTLVRARPPEPRQGRGG